MGGRSQGLVWSKVWAKETPWELSSKQRGPREEEGGRAEVGGDG